MLLIVRQVLFWLWFAYSSEIVAAGSLCEVHGRHCFALAPAADPDHIVVFWRDSMGIEPTPRQHLHVLEMPPPAAEDLRLGSVRLVRSPEIGILIAVVVELTNTYVRVAVPLLSRKFLVSYECLKPIPTDPSKLCDLDFILPIL